MSTPCCELDKEAIAVKMLAADWRMKWEILPGIVTRGISPIEAPRD